MNQPVATVEGYDVGTMGFFDEDGNFWEPNIVSNNAKLHSQSTNNEW